MNFDRINLMSHLLNRALEPVTGSLPSKGLLSERINSWKLVLPSYQWHQHFKGNIYANCYG